MTVTITYLADNKWVGRSVIDRQQITFRRVMMQRKNFSILFFPQQKNYF